MLGRGSLLWALWEEGIPAIRGIMLSRSSVLWALWEEGIPAIREIMLGPVMVVSCRPSGKREFLPFWGIMLGCSVLWALWAKALSFFLGGGTLHYLPTFPRANV